MAPYTYDENGRRVIAPSKGELREQLILDEAEKQLALIGSDAMTVASIASAAGLTRGALYFYYRSKNDVLAALVGRVVVELNDAIGSRTRAVPDSVRDAVESAIDLTRDLWLRHSAVMRAAVELSPSVPVIAHLWNGARATAARSIEDILLTDDNRDEVDGAETSVIVRALVALTERSFYDASVRDKSLDDAMNTVVTICVRALRLE